MFKNVASQKVAVFAWDNAAGAAKTGDAANITAQISIDGAATAATDDTNPTELDATDAPGIYIFDMLQAETNGDLIVIAPVSATSDIVLRPVVIYTNPLTTTRAGYIDELNASGAGKSSYYIAKLAIALLNKMIITEVNGNTEQFDDANSTLGSVNNAFASDGTYTTRLRLVV
jgi:hypothetical protein